jgi:hypothetical protein
MIQGDPQGAYSVLLSTPTDSPDFALAAVKAVAVRCPEDAATASIAALIAGGRADDAVDLAMLTRQFASAARMLIDAGMIGCATAVLGALTDEDEVRVIEERIVAAMRGAGDARALAAFLIARKRCGEAAECLRNEGIEFVPDVIERIRVESGRVWIAA